MKDQNKTAYEQACEEVRTGPFSILSDKALDRLTTLFRLVNDDAWSRATEAVAKSWKETP